MNWTRFRVRRAKRRRSGEAPLRCQEMVELITDYLEGALDSAMRARFEQHLRGCHGCAAYLQELQVTIRVVGALRDEHLDPVFRDRLLATFSGTGGSW